MSVEHNPRRTIPWVLIEMNSLTVLAHKYIYFLVLCT